MADDKKNNAVKDASVSTRFQKGQSGNPKGRPKGAKNKATILEAEINILIPITENGRTIHLSKWAVAIKQLVNKAATGDLRAIETLDKIIQREKKIDVSTIAAEQPTDEKLPSTAPLTAEAAEKIYREALKNAKTENK